MGESSSEEAGGADKIEKHPGVFRALAGDDTTLLLLAVERFKNVALGRLSKGSEASRILEQEMSTRLLHLACRHDAVECARLLLDGGHGITAALVDARDQMNRTPLHIAAVTHSTRCIQLLLSRNARTDLGVVGGTPLVALEFALMSRRAQVSWSLYNSVEDLLAYLQQKDLKAIRLLAEKTNEVGEVAYRYAMEGRVAALATLLLVAENKITATVSVVIDGVRTERSIYNSLVDEVLSIGDASTRDGSERRKALLCEIQLLNQFGASSWKDRDIDKRSLPPLLRAAKAGDMSVTEMLLIGGVDVNETDHEGNTALHWCVGSRSSTQDRRIVWLLLKSGARVFQSNRLGLTPVHRAAAHGNYEALQSLILHAQDSIDIPSKTKETPLFFAVKNGSLSCVVLLLCFGANPKAQNLWKQRPVDVAISQEMHNILNSATVPPVNKLKRKRCLELLDDNYIDINEMNAQKRNTLPKKHSAPTECVTQVHKGAAMHNYEELCTMYVTSPVGKLPVTISLREKVSTLRTMIAKKTDCMHLPEIIGLRFGSKVLENDQKLCSYGLSSDCVLELYVRFLGGQPPEKKPKIKIRQNYDVFLREFAFPDKARPLPDLVNTGRVQSVLDDKIEDSYDLTVTGRKIGKGLVAEFNKARVDRRTWSGDIGLSDFRVKDGQVRLLKESRLTKENEDWKIEWAKDCQAQAKIFRAIFMRDGKVTPYMEYLVLELESVEPKFGWSDWFSVFQRTNLAFKPSHRRLHASQDIWGYFQKLKTKEERDDFQLIIKKVKVPAHWAAYE